MPDRILVDPVGHPDRLEKKYAYKIEKRLVDPLGELLEKHVVRGLQPFKSEINERAQTRQDEWMDSRWDSLRDNLKILTRKFGAVQTEFMAQLDEAEMRRLARELGADVEEYNRTENKRNFSQLLGVDPTWGPGDVEGELSDFTDENLDLITKMPLDVAQRIKGDLEQQLQKGRRWEELTQTVRSKLGVGAYRGELIARDQIGKINGRLNQVRQQQVGVEKYEWGTAGDNRVRPSHSVKDGEIFRWDSPPAGTGHPGQDIQCRCDARAAIEQAISELQADSLRDVTFREDQPDRGETNELPDPATLDFSRMPAADLIDWMDRTRGVLSHIRRQEPDPFGPDDESRAASIMQRARLELRSRERFEPREQPEVVGDIPDVAPRHKARQVDSKGVLRGPLYVAPQNPAEWMATGAKSRRFDVWGADLVCMSRDRDAMRPIGHVLEARAQIHRPLEVDGEFWSGESEKLDHRRVYASLPSSPRSASVADLVGAIYDAGHDAFVTHQPDDEPGFVFVYDPDRVVVVDV